MSRKLSFFTVKKKERYRSIVANKKLLIFCIFLASWKYGAEKIGG
jgi:hypothetical protein